MREVIGVILFLLIFSVANAQDLAKQIAKTQAYQAASESGKLHISFINGGSGVLWNLEEGANPEKAQATLAKDLRDWIKVEVETAKKEQRTSNPNILFIIADEYERPNEPVLDRQREIKRYWKEVFPKGQRLSVVQTQHLISRPDIIEQGLGLVHDSVETTRFSSYFPELNHMSSKVMGHLVVLWQIFGWEKGSRLSMRFNQNFPLLRQVIRGNMLRLGLKSSGLFAAETKVTVQKSSVYNVGKTGDVKIVPGKIIPAKQFRSPLEKRYKAQLLANISDLISNRGEYDCYDPEKQSTFLDALTFIEGEPRSGKETLADAAADFERSHRYELIVGEHESVSNLTTTQAQLYRLVLNPAMYTTSGGYTFDLQPGLKPRRIISLVREIKIKQGVLRRGRIK